MQNLGNFFDEIALISSPNGDNGDKLARWDPSNNQFHWKVIVGMHDLRNSGIYYFFLEKYGIMIVTFRRFLKTAKSTGVQPAKQQKCMEVESVMEPMYISIQPEATGKRIKQMLLKNGYSIRDVQGAFGFENPQAIYKWLSGKSLPNLDNFIILSRLLHTSIEDILVIDGDIPRLWRILNRQLNDMRGLIRYNRLMNEKTGGKHDEKEDHFCLCE